MNEKEDTLSIHEDLVQSTEIFFDKMEVNCRFATSFCSSPRSMVGSFAKDRRTLNSFYHNAPPRVTDELVSAQVWCLIEIAINNTYMRTGFGKKQPSPKQFIDPKETIFFKSKETINGNLSLK